jgi:hypothetical protein
VGIQPLALGVFVQQCAVGRRRLRDVDPTLLVGHESPNAVEQSLAGRHFLRMNWKRKEKKKKKKKIELKERIS